MTIELDQGIRTSGEQPRLPWMELTIHDSCKPRTHNGYCAEFNTRHVQRTNKEVTSSIKTGMTSKDLKGNYQWVLIQIRIHHPVKNVCCAIIRARGK